MYQTGQKLEMLQSLSDSKQSQLYLKYTNNPNTI